MRGDDCCHGVRARNDATHRPTSPFDLNCKDQPLSGSEKKEESGSRKPSRKGFKVSTWLGNL